MVALFLFYILSNPLLENYKNFFGKFFLDNPLVKNRPPLPGKDENFPKILFGELCGSYKVLKIPYRGRGYIGGG